MEFRADYRFSSSGAVVSESPDRRVRIPKTMQGIETAVARAVRLLRSERYRFCFAEKLFPLPLRVRDLGSAHRGITLRDLKGAVYVRLNARPWSENPALWPSRLWNLVLHEMTHVAQFGSPLWKLWQDNGFTGDADPNWWLHEAVALAVEAMESDQPVDWYLWQWEWARHPEKPLTDDVQGRSAALFLTYLMNRFGTSLAGRLYGMNVDPDCPELGIHLLDRLLRESIPPEGSASRPHPPAGFIDRDEPHPKRNLSESFEEYCAEAGLSGRSWKHLPPIVSDLVGERDRCDTVRLQAHIKPAAPIEIPPPMSCRYVDISNENRHRGGTLSVNLWGSVTAEDIRISCTPVDSPDAVAATVWMSPDSSRGRQLSVSLQSPHQTGLWRLCLINSGRGPNLGYTEGCIRELQWTADS